MDGFDLWSAEAANANKKQPPWAMRQRLTPEKAIEAAALVRAGLTNKQVGEKIGIRRDSVARLLSIAASLGEEVPRRKPGRVPATRRVTTITTSDDGPKPAYIEPSYADVTFPRVDL